jgi:putative N6-adenine-specific DNA methylase
MDMQSVSAENGRVYFTGGEEALARANIRSRFGERILLVMGRFDAPSFDALFEGVKALPWEDFIPRSGAFPVKGWALESTLHSVPDCQRIVKKAVVERLKRAYGLEWLPEDGESYPIQFSVMRDRAVLYLDTSGTPLHKRGYRPARVAAPLRETLAAAMVDIARYRGKGEFCDPFCGSGTIAIEAALAALNRAPGLHRSFQVERWSWPDKTLWDRERQAARAREYTGEYRISASDMDPKAVATARANARRAGVEELISFSVADARSFDRSTDNGVICTNPPYGERLLDKQSAGELYRAFGKALRGTAGWRCCILSSHESFENCFGARASKRRRLYNGTIPCQLFLYDHR